MQKCPKVEGLIRKNASALPACPSPHRRGDRSTPTGGDRQEEGADQPKLEQALILAEGEQASRRVMQGEKRASSPTVLPRIIALRLPRGRIESNGIRCSDLPRTAAESVASG